MKILIITTRFYPHIGGVEEVVSNIAENLSTDNEVKVLSSLDSRINFSQLNKIFQISLPEKAFGSYHNKRVWINLPASILGMIIFPARFVLAIAELFTYVNRFKPNIINYHFPDDSSLYVDLLTMVTRTPLVVNIHGNDLHKYSEKLPHKFFISRLLRRATKIIVNSSYMKTEFMKSYPTLGDKVKIIPNGLDVDKYNEFVAKPYLKEPYIFYIGRMVEKKGVDLLVKAFYKLGNSNLKLLIEGKGEELDKIRAMVKEMGIDPQIIFTLGELSEQQKIAAMKGSLFGVIPSRIEPFGIVALEFLAAGTPFIASNTGGLSDLLNDNKTCLFFENGNIDDLASKMELMLSDMDLRTRLAKNGKAEVINYKWDEVSKRYINCFNEII